MTEPVRFTANETAELILLAAMVNPCVLRDDAALALHYKCRSMCDISQGEDGVDRFSLPPQEVSFGTGRQETT